jgi:triosephosphate isomerase
MNQKLMVAVWKEKLNYSQSVQSAEKILAMTKDSNWPFEIGLAPNPFSYVGVASVLKSSNIKLCSQNVLWHPESGSYIGETTTDMLREVGCNYAIVGHSERRLYFSETNEMIANRALAAIKVGIKPIICVGDTGDDREAGRSNSVITSQLRAFFDLIPSTVLENDFLIAYEPVWAISTWRTDRPLPPGTEVQALHVHIRELIAGLKGETFAKNICLLYGGSVAPENAEDYMAQEDVDGALVGGASKTPESYVGTLIAARNGCAKR